MIVGSVLDEIVTRRTVQTALMSVIFVLLAPVTSTSLNVIVARTLSVFVALEPFRSTLVAVTRLAAVTRKPILVRSALIAVQTGHAWLAVALSIVAARRVEASRRIAVTALAPVARVDVEESGLAFVTVPSDYERFASAIAGQGLANGDTVFGLFSSGRIAGALVALAMGNGQRVTKVA